MGLSGVQIHGDLIAASKFEIIISGCGHGAVGRSEARMTNPTYSSSCTLVGFDVVMDGETNRETENHLGIGRKEETITKSQSDHQNDSQNNPTLDSSAPPYETGIQFEYTIKGTSSIAWRSD